jgi:hypothetical protein
VCDKIVSAYAQHAHAIIFENYLKITNLNANYNYKKSKFLKNRLGAHLIGPKWTLWRKNFGISPKQFGSANAQSLRKCLNFKILAKIEGKEAKFFSKIYQGIKGFDLGQEKFRIIHACVPLTVSFMPQPPKNFN